MCTLVLERLYHSFDLFNVLLLYFLRHLIGAGLEIGEIIICCWNMAEGLVQLHTLDTR